MNMHDLTDSNEEIIDDEALHFTSPNCPIPQLEGQNFHMRTPSLPSPASCSSNLTSSTSFQSTQSSPIRPAPSLTVGKATQLWRLKNKPTQWEQESIKRMHAHLKTFKVILRVEEEIVYLGFLDVKRKVEAEGSITWNVEVEKVLFDLVEFQMEKWIEESMEERIGHQGDVKRYYVSDGVLASKAKSLRIICHVHRPESHPARMSWRYQVTKRRHKLRDRYNLNSATKSLIPGGPEDEGHDGLASPWSNTSLPI